MPAETSLLFLIKIVKMSDRVKGVARTVLVEKFVQLSMLGYV